MDGIDLSEVFNHQKRAQRQDREKLRAAFKHTGFELPDLKEAS